MSAGDDIKRRGAPPCVRVVSSGDKRRDRIEAAAERLLENVLNRRRWLAADRDRIADFLAKFADEEAKASKKGEH